MKTILMVDASSDNCAVALCHEDKISSLCQKQPRQHAQLLLPSINQILVEANISINDLDGIAYGRGPGSFAGIRIAASVTQGIHLAQNLPVYGFSSLHALAASVVHHVSQKLSNDCSIFVMINAHMGEVFWAGFTNYSDSLQCTTGEHISDLASALEACNTFSKNNPNTVITGDAIQLPNFDALNVTGLSLVENIDMDLSCVASDISRQYEQGQFGQFKDHQPVYLRDSVSWKKLDEQPKLLQPKKAD